MSDLEFTTAFKVFLRSAGRSTGVSLFDLVEQWEALVDTAESCYYDSWTEFTNELSVRSLLDRVLKDRSLMQFPQLAAADARVQAADKRFASLLIPSVEIGDRELSWWRRGILQRAGEEYVDEVRGLFGIQVQSCS